MDTSNWFYYTSHSVCPSNRGNFKSLKNFKKKIRDKIPKIDAEYIITYNPEKWRYHVYYFVNDLEKVKTEKGVTFTILHISY